MFIRICLLILIIAAFAPFAVQAEEKSAFRSTSYPLPRFVSLASEKVYVRAGPGAQFPIKWEYQKKSLPVEIILEFDTWRKIRDFEGGEGWVHQSLLSGSRTVLIKGDKPVSVRRKSEEKGRLVAYLEPQVVAFVDACERDWCHLEADGYKGWVSRASIWGVYGDEMLQ